MEQQSGLTIETFLAVAEMIAGQLRIREADRWSPHVCQLKYVSFLSEFPEVTEQQFMWAAEQWLQGTGGREFVRYPTWRELMSTLYRSENGLANRTWGFKESLPVGIEPTPQQVAMLPGTPQSLVSPPDPQNAAAYVPFECNELPALPPGHPKQGLTPAQWADYLNFLAEEERAATH